MFAGALSLWFHVLTCLAGPTIGFQGRVQVAGTNHTGLAVLRFSLVAGPEGRAVWKN